MQTEKKAITSAKLKIIALVCMTLDHIGHVFYIPMMSASPAFALLYTLLRFVGRIAFPLYAFMIAEGCRHTKNIKKYFALLAIFAAVSEIPFNIAGNGTVLDSSAQNVYFTLFLGLAACYVVRLLKENGKHILWSAPVAALLCASAYFLSTDYSWYGVLLIWLCAVTQEQKNAVRIPVLLVGLLLIARPWQIIQNDFAFACIDNSCMQLFGSLPALYLICRYNGERGNLRINKYFFYAYYPAHLLILGLLASLLK
ncbi:MAG: hypothetical protein IKB13_00505 [Clostridia bacterium]|nr:hypothetical protein [Clostridia bacterium]